MLPPVAESMKMAERRLISLLRYQQPSWTVVSGQLDCSEQIKYPASLTM